MTHYDITDHGTRKKLSAHFLDVLMNDTIPFWMPRSIDTVHGGYITYCDRRGEPLQYQKNGWVHGRMVWLFSYLYNEVEQRSEWLDWATHGFEFLDRYIIDDGGRAWFMVAQDGTPLQRRRYCYGEIYAVLGAAEYFRATGDLRAYRLVGKAMQVILKFIEAGGAIPPKFEAGEAPARSHDMFLSMVPVLQQMRTSMQFCLDNGIDREAEAGGANEEFYRPSYWNDELTTTITDIFRYFVHPEKKVLLEMVGEDGCYIDSPAGRIVNPGHSIESMWFILDELRQRGETGTSELVKKALAVLEWTFDIGWDDKHGGFFAFVDCDGHQAGPLESDMKFWWPHNEALIATVLASHFSKEPQWSEWFNKVYTWAHDHFHDSEYGEWFGYLHYDGTVASSLKGNYWKSMFHLGRQQAIDALLLREAL